MAYEDGTLTQEEKDALAKASTSNQGFIYSANDRAKAINSPVSAPFTSLSPRVSEQGFVGNMADSVGPALYTVGSGLIGAAKGSYRALGGENRSEERIRINRERKDANTPLNIPSAPARNASLSPEQLEVDPSAALPPAIPPAPPPIQGIPQGPGGMKSVQPAISTEKTSQNARKSYDDLGVSRSGNTFSNAGAPPLNEGKGTFNVIPAYVSDRSVSDYMSPDGTIQTKDFQSALGAAKTPAEKALVMASSKLAQAKSAASGGYDLTPGAFLAANRDLASAEKEYQNALTGFGSSGKPNESMALEAFKNANEIKRDALKFKAQSDRDDMKALTAKPVNTEESIKAEYAAAMRNNDPVTAAAKHVELLSLDPKSSRSKTIKNTDGTTTKQPSDLDIAKAEHKKAIKEKGISDIISRPHEQALVNDFVTRNGVNIKNAYRSPELKDEFKKSLKGEDGKTGWSDENFKRWVVFEKFGKDLSDAQAEVVYSLIK